jgi:excisionase family DNA binding protein
LGSHGPAFADHPPSWERLTDHEEHFRLETPHPVVQLEHLDQMEQSGAVVGDIDESLPLASLRDLDRLLEEFESGQTLDRDELARLGGDIARVLEHGETRSAIHSLLHALARGHRVHVTTTESDLTPAQAADRLGISRKLVNKMLDAGQLSFHRLPQSRHKRIPASEVLRVLQEREATRAGIDAIMDATAEAEY